MAAFSANCVVLTVNFRHQDLLIIFEDKGLHAVLLAIKIARRSDLDTFDTHPCCCDANGSLEVEKVVADATGSCTVRR